MRVSLFRIKPVEFASTGAAQIIVTSRIRPIKAAPTTAALASSALASTSKATSHAFHPRHDEHGTDAIDVAALIVRIRLCTDALEERIAHDLHRPNQTHHRHRRRCVHGDGRGGVWSLVTPVTRDGHGETVRRTRGLCRAVRKETAGLDERMGCVSQPLQEIRLLSGYVALAPSAVKRDARRDHMIRAATALAPLPTTKA